MDSKVVLVCRNWDGKINHVDPGMCYKSWFGLGPYKPKFECGDKKNTHSCEEMNAITAKYLDLIKLKGKA